MLNEGDKEELILGILRDQDANYVPDDDDEAKAVYMLHELAQICPDICQMYR